ncbi:F-box only protein 50 [Acipenser oxyrinchus oxyrinchus]|uniref:F-box only protein 50 n=1 Tax=Acipenser oxyrinchus oxyrinchus TaxID=40147 RepID=A0AAD8CNP9_ACIOX|nr:F-box only protein 50 [Acipenser oxyrinchus oxyrinchus]
MAGACSSEWLQKCEMIWKLKQRNVPAPDSVDWKTVFEKKPIERNLIKTPAPEGLKHTIPPPKHEFDGMMGSRPPQFEPEGDFTGWKTSREDLPLDSSGIPPGAVVCHLPNFSWFTLEQKIDLKGEGLWEELLDVYQPDISIQDWYEDSKLHEEVYQLQVRLLGADGQTVIQEFKLNPKNDTAGDPERWLEVSHVFRGYGPGVRHLHFLHRVKTMRMMDFMATRVTDSSVLVKLRD